MTFRPKIRTTEIEAPDHIAPYEDGSEPFRATIRTSITQADLTRIVGPGSQWADVWPRIAPFVLAWNLDIPAPAEGGPTQFGELETPLMVWLCNEVIALVRQASEAQNATISRNTAARRNQGAPAMIRPQDPHEPAC